MVVDGSLCAIGSSNMDVRSFGLAPLPTTRLVVWCAAATNATVSTFARTHHRSGVSAWHVHYVDNVCRLWSSLPVSASGDEATVGLLVKCLWGQ